MKLFILVFSSRTDGGNENISVRPFETREEALSVLNKRADSETRYAEKAGWETERTETSFESFEPGYEMQNHLIVTLREVELKNDHKVRTVCGEDLACELSENDGRKLTVRNARRRCPSIGDLCQRTFDTQVEVDAYRKGQLDQGGWQETEDGEGHPEITDEVWEKYGKPADY